MLIIEDGSVVPGAESYASVADLRAYAAKRGQTVPVADAECETLLIKAMDYLRMQHGRWKGEQLQQEQSLDWPRWGVEVGGYELPHDQIPVDLKAGQCQLAIDAQSLDLLPTLDAANQRGPVTNETVDVLSVTYGAPSVNRSVSWFQKSDAFLAKFYSAASGQVRLVRG